MDESPCLGHIGRKDTTKGPPLRILSLDGGGIRGYSTLIILQELMHRTFVEIEGRAPKRHEIPKPCEHFDLIAGTGTGGLIAIMLGRLRLDLDTCKDVYVRMTKRAFETDKTVFGLPWKGTMFKASLLENVIKETVREHTIFEDEGNDTLANAIHAHGTATAPNSPLLQRSPTMFSSPHRTVSQNSRYSIIGASQISHVNSMGHSVQIGPVRQGNPNALLYDCRENRTKTAVAAVLKGTPNTILLRSYDSRKEPAPDVNCTIWQAGRATSASQMAFKPIQIGQSVYLDEGGGKYNPAPLILDEAVQNEWPGREVGVFVSIGTGKRPPGTNQKQHEWWEGFMGGSLGEFAEARRKLIAKLENCEKAHEYMLEEHLAARNVPKENYVRLNVEVGVGEFAMNEWGRLAEISTRTRTYLARKEVEELSRAAAVKIAKVHFTKMRQGRAEAPKHGGMMGLPPLRAQSPWQLRYPTVPIHPAHRNFAVELAGDYDYRIGQYFAQDSQYAPSPTKQRSSMSLNQSYEYDRTNPTPTQQQFYPNAQSTAHSNGTPGNNNNNNNNNHSHNVSPYHSPSISLDRGTFLWRDSSRYSSHDVSPRVSTEDTSSYPRPLSIGTPGPPKTPATNDATPYPARNSPPRMVPNGLASHPPNSTHATFMTPGEFGGMLPYPDVEGPPPSVNTASKPSLS